jgi:hypothetical protein
MGLVEISWFGLTGTDLVEIGTDKVAEPKNSKSEEKEKKEKYIYIGLVSTRSCDRINKFSNKPLSLLTPLYND